MATRRKSVFKISPADELNILRRLADLASSELDLTAVLGRVAAIVGEITGAQNAGVFLIDGQNKKLALKASSQGVLNPKASVKMGEGVTGTVAAEMKPVAINRNATGSGKLLEAERAEAGDFESFLSVPIVFKGKTTGVINVCHRQPRQYPAAVVSLIATIGKQVGGLIENARLYDEMKTKALQFDSMIKVSKTITSEKYLDEILNLIVVLTAEMLDSKICSIMLLDEKTDELLIMATSSLSPDYKNKPPLKASASLSGQVVKTKKPLAVPDVKNEARYQHRDLAVRENLSSMLVVPMIVKNKVIGVTNVYTKTPHEFSPQEIDALQIIVNQAAVAIENTKLMEETLKVKEALESRKVIERAKGILMETARLSEEAAYKLIMKKSMDSCRSMKEIAEAIVLTADIGRTQTAKNQ